MEAIVANLLGATALSLSLGGVANVPAPTGVEAAPIVTAQMQACCYGYGYYGYGYAAPGDTTFAQVMGDGWVAGLGGSGVAQYAAPTFAALGATGLAQVGTVTLAGLGDATFAQDGYGSVAGLGSFGVAQVGDGWVAGLGAPAFAQVGSGWVAGLDAPAFAQAAPTFANLGATTFAALGRVRSPTRPTSPTDEATDESDAYVG